MADDRQTQADAAVARRARVFLAEPVEHVRKEVGRNALPGIGHRNLRRVPGVFERHLDAAALGRELHRVRDQVEDHLLQPARIARTRTERRLRPQPEIDSLGLS